MKELIIIGAGGHGRVVADIAKKSGYEKIAFLDDFSIGKSGKYPIIDKISEFIKYINNADFIVAVGNGGIRRKIQSLLKENSANVATLLHPSAVIANNVEIGKGTVVMAGAVINPGVQIGEGVIINTCSSVDHDCILGDYSHISVGAHLCGTVDIGENVWIGAGSTVVNNISICNNCMIGAGAVVIKDIDVSGTYIGVPAKIKEGK